MADREATGAPPQQAEPADPALGEQVLSVDTAALAAGGRSPRERRRLMLALQASAGNAAVSRLMQGVAPPAVLRQVDAAAPPATTLIVAADATSVGANQMRQDQFLDELEQAACQAAEAALAGTKFTVEGCPWITHWIDYYRVRAPRQIEEAMRRYAPTTASVAAAKDCIPLICDRITGGIAEWRETGEIPAAPADGPAPPAAASAAAAPPGVARVERLGPGRPLDASVQGRMEAAFAADFRAVEIHTDPAAAAVSRSQGARALAIGSHVTFAPGEYEPGTPIGDALIAHELAHVIQQGGAPAAAPSGRAVARLTEDEANLAALDIAAGLRPQVARRTGLQLNACLDTPEPPRELTGEEASEAIDRYDIEIAATRNPERGPKGMLATYHVQSNYHQLNMGGPEGRVWESKLIGRPWFVFKPGRTEARPTYPKSLEELEVEFDEAGDWTIRAHVGLPGGSTFVEVDLKQHIDPLEDVAGTAFAQAGAADLVKQRAALELQAIEAGGGAVRDQNTGSDHITLEGAGQNPVRPQPPFGRYSYAFHRSPKAPADAPTPRSYRWYAIPQSRTDFPSGYGGHKKSTFMGKLAFELGEASTASFHIELSDAYAITCEAVDADGHTITTASYRQVVMTEKQAEDVDKIRTAIRKQEERIAKIQRGREIGLKAVHTSKHSGRSTELALFAGFSADGGGYRLIDVTPGVERSEYDGDTLEAAVKDFDDNNTYPEGLIVLEGPGVSRRNIPTDGASDVREVSSGFGWASLGLAALGVVALFTPAAVAAPYLFAASAVAGGTASALSIADELRNNEPNAIKIAVDVVGIAGSIVGLGQAGRAISQGSKVIALSRGAQYMMYTGFGTDVLQGVLLAVDAGDQIEAINKQMREGKITREQATDQIVRLLAMLALTTGLIAYGARDLRGAKSRVGHAIGNEATVRSLQADALHHLDALDDSAITGLKGLRPDELDNVAKVIGTNREGAKRLSKTYGAEFVERARTGRFQTLEGLAEDLGEAAGRRALPEPPAGAGGKLGGHEPEPAKPARTEQGDLDVMGRPDDAIALEYQMGPNAHGEPHVFHMTEGGLIFRCSDFCQDILANIEERTRKVREKAARTQRALDLERNWRREGSEITEHAKRLRDSGRKMARDHQKKMNNIARAKKEGRRAELEAKRQAWLEEARESLMERAKGLEKRMSALEEAVGLVPEAVAGPRQPQSISGLRERYPDVLDSSPDLKKELSEIEKAKGDPAQSVDVERRLVALEEQLIRSVEAGLPEAIARARQMQVAAGNGLITVNVGGRPTSKCRAVAGDVQTISGANAVDGYAQRTREVLEHGGTIGHTFAADNFDETVAGVLNKGKGKAEQVAAKGTARASHAEKQAAMAAPGQPIGVSLPMCFDCYEYFRRYATARGRPVVVADPDMVRVFYPDGRVLAPSRTGTNPLGGAQP